MGTIAYAAPEVVLGGAPGPAADRYALAAVLFECLTGTPVFPRPTHAAVLYSHTHEPPPRASRRQSGIPPALDEVLIAGLAKGPQDRPRLAVDLVRAARVALGNTELGPPAPRVLPEPDDGTTAGHSTRPGPRPATRPGRGRGAVVAVAAALGGLLVGGAAVALLSDDEPAPAPAVRQVEALPPPPEGTVLLGSDLSEAGRTVGCDGGPLELASPGCTIFQEELEGTTLVVQRHGVVRRWGVRSMVGEVALAVLRRRDGGYIQINRSRSEFVTDGRPTVFATDIAVERGDRLGLRAVDGTGIGVVASEAGTTGRYVPALAGPSKPAKPGVAGELLLRADVLEGGRQRQPPQTVGAAAERLPDGDALLTERGRFTDGTPFEIRLVSVDGHGFVDVFEDGRRRGRLRFADFLTPLGSEPSIDVVVAEDLPHYVGMDIMYTRPESARVIRHFLDFAPKGFTVYG